MSMSSNEDEAHAIPAALGKYRPLRLLGSGGMGSVYLAEDPDIGRRVAIKLVSIGSDADSRARFRREAKTLGQLSHPNIVTLYEYGEHEGQQFLVLEYLAGQDLSEWMEQPHTLHQQVGVMLDVARALAAAHAVGILHRDIKPGNVRVLPNGTTKLLDFGIARGNEPSGSVTATGMIVGTPDYMAPEVIEGSPPTARSDLHALGVMIYNVLTGKSVFAASGYAATLLRVTQFVPPTLEKMVDGVPPKLSALISACLKKDPSLRPESAQEVASRLEEILKELSPDLRVAPRAENTRLLPASVSGRRRTWPALAILLLLLAIGLGFVLKRGAAVPATPDQPQAASQPDALGSTPISQPQPPTAQPAPASDALRDQSMGQVGPAHETSDVLGKTDAASEGEQTLPARQESPQKPKPASLSRVEMPPMAGSAVERSPTSGADIAKPLRTGTSSGADETGGSTAPTDAGATTIQGAAEGAVDTAKSPLVDSAAATSLQPAPMIDAISPPVLRSGRTVRVQLTGRQLSGVTSLVVLRSGSADGRFGVNDINIISASRLEFTISVARNVPLGRYSLVAMAGNSRSAPVLLEVSL